MDNRNYNGMSSAPAMRDGANWRSHLGILDAESAFKSLRRRMAFKRITSLFFRGPRQLSRQIALDKNSGQVSEPKLPLSEIKGTAGREGKFGMFPIPGNDLKPLWTKLWLREDPDAFPEAEVIKTEKGWYLAGDARSLVVYLLLRHKGANEIKVAANVSKESKRCRTFDFKECACGRSLAS